MYDKRIVTSEASRDLVTAEIDDEQISKPGEAPRLTVAVVGSGPSGCYVSQFLAKKWPNVDITVLESLPTPYGLVRYGVAADHQGAKTVIRQFDRLFSRSGVRFAGNITVGKDVEFDALADAFDVVVLATGLPGDRTLDIDQYPEVQVLGAGALLRSLNGYPVALLPRDDNGRYRSLGRSLAVVGMGNVAIDVARLMAKSVEALAGSDIDDAVLEQLRPSRMDTINIISRSGPSDAKCDIAMLRELIELPDVGIGVTGIDDQDAGPVVDLLRPFVSGPTTPAALGASKPTHLNLHFRQTPASVSSNGETTVLRTTASERGAELGDILVDSVIAAIGFINGGPETQGHPSAGWSGDNVYRVGWLRRGPQGTIPENRRDAQQVADTIIADLVQGRLTTGSPGFTAIAPLLRGQVVDYQDWQRIESIERRHAPNDRCRRKISDLDQMLAIAVSRET
ncbi:FAD-dependent oxidoreductase [Rhodococcus triatomae]|nr:oxidoreductase [Rhodococcus triatomae BKS 15-14]